jgi:GR25 family glycosyltransferase involved in LPS biosynthesis
VWRLAGAYAFQSQPISICDFIVGRDRRAQNNPTAKKNKHGIQRMAASTSHHVDDDDIRMSSSRENMPTPAPRGSEKPNDAIPVVQAEPNLELMDVLEREQLLCGAFTRVCCINLHRRQDRWKTFCSRLESTLGERGRSFIEKVERFDAVDGAALFDDATEEGTSSNDRRPEDLPCLLEWDATKNAMYDRHIQPPMTKRLTPGEVGCVMSHVNLWREVLNCDKPDSRMLILEDDVVFYRGNKKQEESLGLGFVEAFSSLWKAVPSDWDILYLGFCNIGKRIPVVAPSCCQGDVLSSMEITIFRPTYGFYTHAYALSKSAASILLSNLPVSGPLDVWLADNQWFGLNVYCGAVANEGWNGKGASLVSQRREDSDIVHSAHHA